MACHVVLGLGGGLDYELKLSAQTLERLVEEYQIRAADLTALSTVASERDLVISILWYIAKGEGGERFVASSAALQAFADRFPHRTSLGGTSIRAAIAMSRLGVPSTLHLVSLNDVIRRLLPATCAYISSGGEDTFYPHLIVQYDQDLEVRALDIEIRAPFPNRLIYVNDPVNEALALSDELGCQLRAADIFLISGLNAIRDEAVLDQRLSALRAHMRRLPTEAMVFYEDAGFHEPAFSQRIRDALVDAIDIYGLNEDEMQSYLGRSVDLTSVSEAQRALTSLRSLIAAPTLVVHTKFWSAAVGERASQYHDPGPPPRRHGDRQHALLPWRRVHR
jgi:ADP-dependent phosphofructokinase/glucokinase